MTTYRCGTLEIIVRPGASHSDAWTALVAYATYRAAALESMRRA